MDELDVLNKLVDDSIEAVLKDTNDKFIFDPDFDKNKPFRGDNVKTNLDDDASDSDRDEESDNEETEHQESAGDEREAYYPRTGQDTRYNDSWTDGERNTRWYNGSNSRPSQQSVTEHNGYDDDWEAENRYQQPTTDDENYQYTNNKGTDEPRKRPPLENIKKMYSPSTNSQTTNKIDNDQDDFLEKFEKFRTQWKYSNKKQNFQDTHMEFGRPKEDISSPPTRRDLSQASSPEPSTSHSQHNHRGRTPQSQPTTQQESPPPRQSSPSRYQPPPRKPSPLRFPSRQAHHSPLRNPPPRPPTGQQPSRGQSPPRQPSRPPTDQQPSRGQSPTRQPPRPQPSPESQSSRQPVTESQPSPAKQQTELPSEEGNDQSDLDNDDVDDETGEDEDPEVEKPAIICREMWGALPATGDIPRQKSPASTVVFSVNTHVPACDTPKECMRRVRQLQASHMGQGLADIKYSFLMGGDGYIYEGRGWDLESGVDKKGLEGTDVNIAYIGQYEGKDVKMPPIMVRNTHKLIQYARSAGLLTPDHKNYANVG